MFKRSKLRLFPPVHEEGESWKMLDLWEHPALELYVYDKEGWN